MLVWQAAFNISDKAVQALLKFIKYFILIIGKAFKCDSLSSTYDAVPLTLSGIRRQLGYNSDMYINYVVCPKCSALYEYKDCVITRANGEIESKTCCHVVTPNHPQRSKRRACGCILLKKQKRKNTVVLVPRKVYPYQSLIGTLQKFLKRAEFLEACEHWRNRPTSDSFLGDIYDGEVWEFFKSDAAGRFLSTPHSYLLSMNIDWFQPFVRGTTYSVGAIYLTIQNLPRHIRYRQENIILLAIIPGPKEPKLHMNSYLTPLIEELHKLWNGVLLTAALPWGDMPVRIRAALSCVACDIPASRKVCGFLGHNAKLGCNKCLKVFAQRKNRRGKFVAVYGGYDRENWTLRNNEQHRDRVVQLKNERSTSALRKAESSLGVRYSVLLSLPYFDPVRFTVVDPMHNLYLGSGKHVFKVWMDRNLITLKHLEVIEEKMKKFKVPSSAGRLPSNISSSHGGFTANQWNNWILIYSPILLKGILPNEHLRCWLLFVRACSFLKPRFIEKRHIISADLFLLQFCKEFEQLYGQNSCTPNMHLHLHLKNCLVDYGPLHAFWCYPFERFNGILGSIHTNRKSIEPQLMKKFCQSQEHSTTEIGMPSDFIAVLPEKSKINYKSCTDVQALKLFHMAISTLDSIESFALADNDSIRPLPPFKIKTLQPEQYQQLKKVYEQLYPSRIISRISHFYNEYGRSVLGDDIIGSTLRGPNCHSSSVIAAFWPGSGSSLGSIDYCQKKIGVIQFFMTHSLELSSNDGTNTIEKLKHVFAFVRWMKVHPDSNWFGQSAIVNIDIMELPDACCFMPIQRIANVCAHARIPVEFASHTETVFIACPLPLKYSF